MLENNKWFYYCLKYRKCCICGKHADVCHIEVVGMG
ncbi:putative HNHc nuclease, partial [Streptococcus pyogenes]